MTDRRSNLWLNLAILVLIAFFGGLLALFVFSLTPYPSLEFWIWGGLGVLFLVHVGAMWLRRDAKLTVVMLGASVVGALYIGELVLETTGFTLRYVKTDFLRLARIERAQEQNVPFDRRNRLEVIIDERKAGRQAFSGMAGHNTSPSGAVVLPDGREMYAFGGISRVRIVDCNETGEYSSYVADERGFNNPLGLWGRNDIAIVTLGGSFVHGACLPREKTMVGQIRKQIEPLTLNLSATGPAPLEDFARLAEFGPRLQPDLILWFFYEQFIFSAQRDALEKAYLAKYLDDPSPRGAYEATEKIDAVLLKEHDRLMREAIEKAGDTTSEHDKYYTFGLRNLVSLRNIRFWFGAVRQTRLESLMTDEEMASAAESLDRTIAAAKHVVAGWGGKIVIVYINGYNRFQAPRKEWKRAFPFQKEFFDIVRKNELSHLDLSVEFAGHEAPSRLYPFGLEGHFSQEGAAFAANKIKEFLVGQGYRRDRTGKE